MSCIHDGLSCLKSLSSILGLLISLEKIGEELIKLLSHQCQEATCLGKKNSLVFQINIVLVCQPTNSS